MTQVWSATQINGRLSGGGTTTVTDTGTDATSSSAYGSEGFVSGKWYFEAKITAAIPTNYPIGFQGAGVGNTSASTADGEWIGHSTNQLGIYLSGSTTVGWFVGNNLQATSAVAVANGDILGYAIDLDNNGVAFRDVTQNSGWFGGAAAADPATNTNMFSLTQSGFTITALPVVPAITLYNSTAGGDVGIAFFSQSSWTGSAPSGFGPFDPSAVTTVYHHGLTVNI